MYKQPLVSIIVPIYNTEKYIDECVGSLARQTYENLEILLMNDGSTDNSLQLLDEWCKRDGRLKLHTKKNTGYGDTVNTGIRMAGGKYIMLLESDDFTAPETVEELVQIAEENAADFVKADYYTYCNGRREKKGNLDQCICGKVFSANENMMKFTVDATVWSCIYKKSFIDENKIWFLETPGASYQDIGFIFKVFVAAKRGYFIPKAYVSYRIDNENASVKSRDKAMAVLAELDSCEKFLKGYDESVFGPWLMKSRYNVYNWNLKRIALQYVDAFVEKFASEIKNDVSLGRYVPELYDEREQKAIPEFIREPEKTVNAAKADKLDKEYQKDLSSIIIDCKKSISDIYIYGAGKIGHLLYDYLRNVMPEKRLVFVSTNGAESDDVICIDCVTDYKAIMFIAIASADERVKILLNLKDRGFEKIFVWNSKMSAEVRGL